MTIRAGILGTGNMGKKLGLRLLEQGGEISCFCGRSEKSRRDFREAMQQPGMQEFTEFDEMLAQAQMDVLFICLPPYAQKDQFEKAAKKGIHIFIEKPIALNTETGKRMVLAARESNITTRVGFHMREGAAVKELKRRIAEGRAGKPVLFNGQYSCNSLHTPWWVNVNLCGGQIFEQAIHVYDMCRYLIGDPKYTIGVMNNQCHNHLPQYTVEDVSASISGFTNGAVASITANNCEIPGAWVGSFKVVFERMTVEFQDQNHAVFTYTDQTPVKTEVIEADTDAYTEEIRDFLVCVEAGKDTECNIEEGYRSLLFVEKVVESARVDGAKLSVRTGG